MISHLNLFPGNIKELSSSEPLLNTGPMILSLLVFTEAISHVSQWDKSKMKYDLKALFVNKLPRGEVVKSYHANVLESRGEEEKVRKGLRLLHMIHVGERICVGESQFPGK